MSKESDVRASIDNARLNTRLATLGWISSLVLLVVTLVLSSYRGGDVFRLGAVAYALATLFGVATMIYGMLAGAAAQEEEEKQLLSKRAEARALDVEEDVRFTAGRSFENYKRFAPYVLTILAALLVGGALISMNRFWAGREGAAITGNAIHSALIAAVMLLLSIFPGAFFIGQSRTAAFRWLRPVGAWLVAGFAIMAVATVSFIAWNSNLVRFDAVASQVIFWLLALLGVEFITNFVIEFYRPRTIRESRPVFESRLLALVTEPGGVMRNIASALDYQFGFKVSGTWLYSFLERSFFPVVLIWALLFWGFTMIHEVGPSQVGVRECLGRIVDRQPLQPGIYWTLPRPFGAMRIYSCTELQQVVIGESGSKTEKKSAESADDGHGYEKKAEKPKDVPTQVVQWTVAHGADDANFVVAVPTDRNAADSGAASISFVRMSIPIQYRIRPDGVMDYALLNASPRTMLKAIGEQVAARYLASSSMDEVMSSGRGVAEKTMRQEVQRLADAAKLGIEIVSLSILDAHPPTGNEQNDVAKAYQDVIGAMEQKETAILTADAYAAQTGPESQAMAMEIVSQARAYEHEVKAIAAAESERFKTQLDTYRIMPQMFVLRSFLDFLENDCRDMRKFVVSSDLSDEVYQFNFEQKERLDLVDTDITKLTNK